jgi:hypothetical protein
MALTTHFGFLLTSFLATGLAPCSATFWAHSVGGQAHFASDRAKPPPNIGAKLFLSSPAESHGWPL